MGGVCREPCRHSVSPNSFLRARGSKLPAPPTCILGEDRAPVSSFPLRSPRTAPMKCRQPCLALPLPLGTAGVKVEGWPGVHSHSYSKNFPHFPDFALATGAPILPAGSWALPAASVQLAFLPVCLLESACGG